MPELRDLQTGDAGWVLERHALHYLRSDGFGREFEAVVAEVLARFLRRPDPVRERAWIAEEAGQRVGCIFLFAEDEGTARLRLFYVDDNARGQGLGTRLLRALLAEAHRLGYARVAVATHESHAEAGRLYAATGFRLLRSEQALSFGRDMVVQHWEIGLPAPDPLAIGETRR